MDYFTAEAFRARTAATAEAIKEASSRCFARTEPDSDFNIGDVVSLIVGGPDMVVLDVCECGNVEVAWATSDGDVMRDAFPEEALIEVV